MLRLHLLVALIHQGGEDVEEVLVEAVSVLPGLTQVRLDEGRHHYYRLTITTELQTKVKLRFAKISHSWRRPLQGPFPG